VEQIVELKEFANVPSNNVARRVCGSPPLALRQRGEAQELAGSFEQLRVLVKPGDTVSVLDRAGQEVRGTISELSSSALALTVAGNRRRFLEGDIDAIRKRGPDSLANGAKWGLAAGAGLGLLAGISLAAEYDEGAEPTSPCSRSPTARWAPVPARGIDALVSSDRVIFARRDTVSKLTVGPMLRRGRTGFLASLRF
jgi:hypothetical protein